MTKFQARYFPTTDSIRTRNAKHTCNLNNYNSVHLTFASRLIYLSLNVWNEAGKALPELSHQQYFASMLEYLCNSAFHRDNEHTRMLAETIDPEVRQRLRHESLIGPNPNLYVFQARKIIQAITWHLTETIWVYQKKVIKA
ncbi:hypothetical protein MIR68_008725 [Amoeboaphelidium protococcarum]|nr:hypothetical protein MIR68_008725 [Amoeboaphelidium protococcarum]